MFYKKYILYFASGLLAYLLLLFFQNSSIIFNLKNLLISSILLVAILLGSSLSITSLIVQKVDANELEIKDYVKYEVMLIDIVDNINLTFCFITLNYIYLFVDFIIFSNGIISLLLFIWLFYFISILFLNWSIIKNISLLLKN